MYGDTLMYYVKCMVNIIFYFIIFGRGGGMDDEDYEEKKVVCVENSWFKQPHLVRVRLIGFLGWVGLHSCCTLRN